MSERMTTALADCAKHHVAIPANQLERKSTDWKCPYCRIAELELQVKSLQELLDMYGPNATIKQGNDDE